MQTEQINITLLNRQKKNEVLARFSETFNHEMALHASALYWINRINCIVSKQFHLTILRKLNVNWFNVSKFH